MQLAHMTVGDGQPLFVIAGPCVIETESLIMSTAETLKQIGEDLGVGVIFKSSFDKANRSSIDSYRGPGIEEGLRILQKVKTELQMPVLTDVHEDTPLDEVASVVDVMQTPAFLCRQTNFIVKVCEQSGQLDGMAVASKNCNHFRYADCSTRCSLLNSLQC